MLVLTCFKEKVTLELVQANSGFGAQDSLCFPWLVCVLLSSFPLFLGLHTCYCGDVGL